MGKKKLTRWDLQQMKDSSEKAVWITAYDYWNATFAEKAGIDADGQLMISSDVAGVFQAFTPKFVKKYENLAEKTVQAFSAYRADVKEGRFPAPEHTYKMVEGELDKLTTKLN